MTSTTNVEQLRSDWIQLLTELINQIEEWMVEMGWSTKRIEISLKDPQLGKYHVPALVMQEHAVKVLLEPITHAAPGADGVADLYLMPGYDDIASLYHSSDGWKIHYMFSDSPTVNTIREATAKPLSKESLKSVLEEMKQNVQ